MAAGAKVGMKMISLVISIPVGIATKKVVEQAWLVIRPDDPPRKPTEADVHWSDAVSWAAVSAVGIVLAELITRRSTEVAYRAITGAEPPPAKPGKAAKKLQKASEKAKITAD
jgi:hypothetical protein